MSDEPKKKAMEAHVWTDRPFSQIWNLNRTILYINFFFYRENRAILYINYLVAVYKKIYFRPPNFRGPTQYNCLHFIRDDPGEEPSDGIVNMFAVKNGDKENLKRTKMMVKRKK